MNNKLNKGGFTLIELLVVVLIIGILSSIALPQYTKAVEKSRSAEAMTYAADWVNAQAIYKMANGKYAEAESGKPSKKLDITLPDQLKNFTMADKTPAAGTPATLQLTRENSSSKYQLVVTMTNNSDDGSDNITRTCNGTEAVCKSIISGLNNTGTTITSSWKYGSTTIAS